MSNGKEWYLIDKTQMDAKGPFGTEELIRRIKAGSLRVDDYIWAPHLGDNWKRIYEIEDFSQLLTAAPKVAIPKRSRGLSSKAPPKINFEKEGAYGLSNVYRRFPRAPLSGEIILHNQRIYRRATCIDISEKGVFLHIDDLQAFQKGDEVTIVLNAPEIGVFSAVAVIIRVAIDGDSKGYGLFFLRLNPMIRRKIAKYVVSKLGSMEAQASTQDAGQAAAQGAA